MKQIFRLLLVTAVLLAGLVSVPTRASANSKLDPKLAMPSTIRQQIVDKLTQRLARITVANGFQTDIGATAAEDWPTHFNEDQLRDATRLGIFDQVNTSEQSFPQEKAIPNTLPLQVRIFHSQKTTPAELRVMIGDVMKAIIENEVSGQRDPQFRTFNAETNKYVPESAIAVDTKPQNDGFIIPTETFSIDGAAVGFTVEFYSEPFNAWE